MNNLMKESWLPIQDGPRNPERHLGSVTGHYLMGVLVQMWSRTLAVFSGPRVRERQQVSPALSGGSRCVWKLDSEA